jgi:hypothetical protein
VCKVFRGPRDRWAHKDRRDRRAQWDLKVTKVIRVTPGLRDPKVTKVIRVTPGLRDNRGQRDRKARQEQKVTKGKKVTPDRLALPSGLCRRMAL